MGPVPTGLRQPAVPVGGRLVSRRAVAILCRMTDANQSQAPTPEQLAGWTTEAANPASERLDAMSALEIARVMNDEDRRVAEAVTAVLPQIAAVIDHIAAAFRAGGRLLYLGAGTSGRLGVLDAAECPPTFSADPTQVVGIMAGGDGAFLAAVEGAEDDPERGAAELREHGVGSNDVVVGIAASGRTPYVLGAMQAAREVGARTACIACNADSALARSVDDPITVVVGPEVVSGSTRLKAGTATKLVLNMLTTGAFVRVGKTFGNRMVDVHASNEKLVARARRMVQQLGGVDLAAAAQTLDAASGEVKTAIAMLKTGLDADGARTRLTECGGRLRDVIESAGA